ncbi:glyoxalase/bleomycin resistance/dioxygenase family protein [Flavobacterium piscis]|uniref:Glyoxalase n=1 Tax=Flavobacterium piscis TaxID=1114874 RepID=A0ABX2XJJ1_9FLAO|nr:VOC family protein [Flavobacterium piscis]OCB73473.1 glyoxalase [Flavobacterium piscis]OXE96345.1 glyoxalase/bleomycin resistance/dioxygenase family protein [Flavobacterium piscis]
MNNIIGFHHFAIKAQDFERTVQFYQTLNFEVVHDWSLPEFNLEKCVMLKNKTFDSYIEICDYNASFPTQGRKRKQGDPYVENSLLHICFTVLDAKKAYDEAIKNGAKPLSAKETLDLKNRRKTVTVSNSLVYSPNGEVIEFLESVVF